jgi:hypothetical protein
MDETMPIQTTRKVDYTLEDPVFEEPFDVYKSANAWWISEKAGNIKVERLVQSFKQCMKVNQAIVLAGISRGQWEYFNTIHPKFSGVKVRCGELVNMYAKATIAEAVKKDWRAAMWFLECHEPEMFSRRKNQHVGIPDSDSHVGVIAEAFVDKDGNLISKRKPLVIENNQPNPIERA